VYDMNQRMNVLYKKKIHPGTSDFLFLGSANICVQKVVLRRQGSSIHPV
jgi:hypothetical protein